MFCSQIEAVSVIVMSEGVRNELHPLTTQMSAECVVGQFNDNAIIVYSFDNRHCLTEIFVSWD
jgi:hypothetical protein